MEPRALSPELAADIAAPVLQPFIAERIELPDPVYAFTGTGTIRFATVDGIEREWSGAGKVAAIGTTEEASNGSATGTSSTLFAIPEDFRDDVAEQAVRGALYERYICTFDAAYQVVRAVKRIWKGTLQSFAIDDAAETLSVTVGGESRAIDQKRPSIVRMTDEYQQRMYAADKGFEYVARLTEVPILWSRAKQDVA